MVIFFLLQSINSSMRLYSAICPPYISNNFHKWISYRISQQCLKPSQEFLTGVHFLGMSRIPLSRPKFLQGLWKPQQLPYAKLGVMRRKWALWENLIWFHFRMAEIKTRVCIKNGYAHLEKWMDLVEEACSDFNEKKILVF